MSIVAENLSKRFGAVRGVCGVSCAIGGGELVGLLGPNGAGKTSILRMLATYLTPDSGRAVVAGFDCRLQGAEVRRRLGYLPETLPAASEARVDEYLAFRTRLKDIPRRQRGKEIDRCLTACRLTGIRRRLLGRLSHGMKRRVGLAESLLGNPPVLLLDEPTIGLDPLQVVETRELLRSLAGQHTVLLSTHLLAEAEAICGRALLLVDGRLAADVRLDELRRGTALEIELRGPAHDIGAALQRLAGAGRITVDEMEQGWLRCAVGGTGNICEAVAAEAARRGWAMRKLQPVGTSLEEYFVRLAMQPREAA